MGARTLDPTKRQLVILGYICGYREIHNGVSPTGREIAQAVGRTRQAAFGIITELREKGLLEAVDWDTADHPRNAIPADRVERYATRRHFVDGENLSSPCHPAA